METRTSPSPPQSATAFFGGPGCAPRRLRDLLEERIEEVAPGGSIDWMTYYFRDEALAKALVRARRRDVSVRVCLEGRPRCINANAQVIRILGDPANGIGDGLRVVRHAIPMHLHSKAFCFSGPRPVALAGSFNPSGNDPEDPRIVARIGDQDRGHNLLVELDDPTIVSAIVGRIAMLHRSPWQAQQRARIDRSVIRSGSTELAFYPRLGPDPLRQRLEALDSGSSLRIAASHVRDPGSVRLLARLVGRGVAIELLTGSTRRRTPPAVERRLLASGVQVRRLPGGEELPMHCKFMLADGSAGRWSAFGSYNLTRTSRWLNHELLAFSGDQGLWSSLEQRWTGIVAQAPVA